MKEAKKNFAFSLHLDHFTSLKLQHTEALQKIQEQNTLIGRLESDLSLVHPYLPVRGEGEGQDATPTSAEIISEAIKDIHARAPSERKSVGEMTGADSLLPIVSSQRERFKQRNMELEAVSTRTGFCPHWSEVIGPNHHSAIFTTTHKSKNIKMLQQIYIYFYCILAKSLAL